MLHDEYSWVMIVMSNHGELCGVFNRYAVAVESIKMSVSDETLGFALDEGNHLICHVTGKTGYLGWVQKVPINQIGVGMTSF